MTWDLTLALHLTKTFLAVTILLQSIEFLFLKAQLSRQKIWIPNLVRLLIVAGTLLVTILWKDTSHFYTAAWFSIWILTIWILRKLGGHFNGGSDSMTMVILTSLTLALLIPIEIVQVGLVWYICIQTLFSYFIAGISKLKEADWRNGLALKKLLLLSNYNVPPVIKSLTRDHYFIKTLSWLVILFELSAPLTLIHPELASAFVLIAVTFHFSNFLILGLNRFVWAWMASYPSLIYCAYYVAKNFN